MEKIKYRVLHHTAVLREDKFLQFNAVNNYHRQKFGGKSALGYWMGYTGFIDGNGIFTQTRLVGEESYAVIGHNCDIPSNCDSVSFCLAFNGEKEVLNKRQRNTVKKLYNGEFELKTAPAYSDFDIKKLEDKFHREMQDHRVCPGGLITHQYLDDLLNETFETEYKKKNENEDIRNADLIKLQSEVTILQDVIAILLRFINRLLGKK